ncbi:MAG TPA: hypothetical protein VNN17_09795 [Terriglobia bacterium]|nr:hypothetical protein [Terriglobia bacterium]
MGRAENPFVFGEVIEEKDFVNRTAELDQLVRDLADGQKVFLLSPRRFGKSSLVSAALLRLSKRHIRTVNLTVSSYSSYAQFLEKFAEKVIRAAGPWQQTKEWVRRFVQRVKPQASIDMASGEISLSLGRAAETDPSPLAPEIFALPGELTRHGGFRMAICLDEFQQVSQFNGNSVENTIWNEVQKQRKVGYVFVGSQPSLVEEMLSSNRPFHKAGPRMFLDKISSADWKEFIVSQFRKRGRTLEEAGLRTLLTSSDLIPYDVQRIAHELWDYAELQDKQLLNAEDVTRIVDGLVASQATYYELQWEQLSARQRAVLQAIAHRGAAEIYSHAVRQEFRLGPASSVQKALQALDSRDILDRYKGSYFFLDPLFPHWIKKRSG